MADVYKRTLRARTFIERNGVVTYNQEFLSSDVTCTETLHQRVVLATNMSTPQSVDMSHIGTAATMQLECDRAVKVFVNTNANSVTLDDTGLLMMTGSITKVYLQNTNTTYTATVEIVLTD